MRQKKYSRVGSGEYSFECSLAFINIQPWANSKWPIDQSEWVLYNVCYVIMHFVFKLLYHSHFCSLFYLFINNMLKSFYLISVITLLTTTCRLLILFPGRTLGSHFTSLLIMFPCTMRDLNRYMLCTAI